jgi:hypothetical protein
MRNRSLLALLLAAATISVISAAAPGPPQNLAVNVAGNTVTLTWQLPIAGGPPSSYTVEASLTPAGVGIASIGIPASPLVVPNVPNGVYYVRVVAVNADGPSTPSNEVVVIVPGGGSTPPTGGCNTAPNAPQNLVGSATGNIVTLNWTVPIGGCPATSYAVHAGTATGLNNIAIANVGGALSLSAGAPAGSYFIRVVASNAFGSSAESSEVLVTVGSSCPVPAAPFLFPPVVTQTSPDGELAGPIVQLVWMSAPRSTLSGYIVEAAARDTSRGARRDRLPPTPLPAHRWDCSASTVGVAERLQKSVRADPKFR